MLAAALAYSGSSDGPMVVQNGKVAGLIFAKSDETPGYGYALSARSIGNEVEQAGRSQRHVSTGACLSN